MAQPMHFGEELRRRRLAAGLTLTGLARMVHYSKSQLSKVERGIKKPSRQLARLCDVELHAEGALAALVQEEPLIKIAGGNEEVLLMRSADGHRWLQPMNRRQAVTAGAVSVVGMSIGGSEFISKTGGTSLLDVSRKLFEHYRKLGQVVEPGLLLPVLAAQTRTLQELSTRSEPRTRQGLLRLGSRYAEYIGWLVQETGDEQAALWWTRHAVDLAAAGEDHDLAAYGQIRHALVTLYRDDAKRTIELSRGAQRDKIPPRIGGLAAQHEAQGYALLGNYDACMRSLERARILLARHTPDPDAPVLGTTNLADPAEMIRGWCLYDLGRPQAAADVLEAQLAQVPPEALRTRVRYGVRHALAHAAAGEVEHSCRLTRELLDGAVAVSSATIAVDLRKLARTLARHPKNSSVRALTPALRTAIRSITA